MAKLKKCKDCGTQVSKKASTCPSCGSPLKRKSIGLGGLIVILVAVGVWVNVFESTQTAPSKSAAAKALPTTKAAKQSLETKLLAELKTIPAEKLNSNQERYQKLNKMFPSNEKYKNKLAHYTAKIARKEKIERQFSAWSGSHKALENYIRKNLKDPDSYDHVETRYGDKGDHILIQTTYRAKNSFNAVITESVIAKAGIDGSNLTIINN